MKKVLVDSGFWFAYFGTRNDSLQSQAKCIFNRVETLQCSIIVPFPSLYETINTKLLKDKNKAAADWFFKQLSTNTKYILVFDDKYRETAFIETTANHKRGISLVDNILRVMMKDKKQEIDTLITFNSGDFIDVCMQCGIELINECTKF